MYKKLIVVTIIAIFIITGVSVYLAIPTSHICPVCHGNPSDEGATCGYCKGDGYINPGDEGYSDQQWKKIGAS